ncbi:MAG: glycosyltransferase, partial [Actinomycetota bacterium]|nr:glycosyltransferase [Actinomycetota bacterium]
MADSARPTSASPAQRIVPGGEQFSPRELSASGWWALRLLAVGTVLASAVYLTWRILATIDGAPRWIAIPFWLLELHGAARFTMTVAELWDSDARVVPLSDALPNVSVAVVIPTYDEGPEVLLPTVAAALEVRGEHETWVLDDGHRPEVEAMADQLGCGYISRPTNEHAKAGNLNYALGVVTTDIIAVLDADHVPQPNFLERTLPYFHEPDVALVQTPQEFYNVDSFVHAAPDHHEEMFFHRVIQAGKNRFGAAFWCGTGSVMRAEALRSVGGASTVSITEDLHTAMLLQRQGWRTIHHNEPLARGLAPRNYEEFSKQRWRWGAGAMQSFAVDFPLSTPGLTRGQRFAYFASFVSWFDSWRSFLYFLVPLAVLITGASPISAAIVPLLPAALAILTLQLATVRLMGRGSLRLWFAAVNEFLRMPVNLSSTLVFLRPRLLGFSVTPKGRTEGERTRYQSPLLLRVMAVVACGSAMFGVASLFGLTAVTYRTPSIVAIAMFWLFANLVVLTMAMRRIADPRYDSEQRGAVRLQVPAVVQLADRQSKLIDVSMGGARVSVLGDWRATQDRVTELKIGFTRTITLQCKVAKVHEAAAT